MVSRTPMAPPMVIQLVVHVLRGMFGLLMVSSMSCAQTPAESLSKAQSSVTEQHGGPMIDSTNDAERIVSTVDEIVAATKSSSVRQIFVTRSLTDVPGISLSAGQSLRGDGDRIILRFTRET